MERLKRNRDTIPVTPNNISEKPKTKKLRTLFTSSPSTDLVSYVVPECIDLILQHCTWYEILKFSLVSLPWACMVHKSSVAMKKIVFNLRPESSERLEKSTREYHNINVYHDDIGIQRMFFLSPVLTSLQSLRSLSFNGTFDKPCIDHFFDLLERNKHNFKVDYLTFYGNIPEINLLLRRFSVLKTYKTVTLVAFAKNTFLNIFHLIRTEKLFLCGMKIKSLNQSSSLHNDCVNDLHLSATKVDMVSVECLMSLFTSLTTMTIENWVIETFSKQEFVERCSSNGLEVKIISNPPADYFLLSSTLKVHNLIFQHFTSEDLLSVSTVSKAWFNISKDKISKDLQFNLRSSKLMLRTYENICTTMNEKNTSIVKLSHYTSNLRELNLELMPKSSANLISLFSNLNLNNLTLLNVTCHEPSPLDDLKLPTTLKILHLSNFFLRSPNSSSAFFQFLSEAKFLEDLQFFETKDLEIFFLTNVGPKIQFKLRSLRLLIDETNQEVSQNFQTFLNIQASTLEVLSVNKIHFSTIEALAKNSCITTLEVQSLHLPMEDFTFPEILKTLTDLKVPTIENFEDVKVLMKLAPNLEKIYLFRLSEMCLDFMRTNLEHLKEIQFTRRQKLIPNIEEVTKGIILRRNSFYGENISY